MNTSIHQVVHWVGYDIIYAMPGTRDAINCPSCGTPMTVTRNSRSPAGRYLSPAPKRPRCPRDIFVCPHAHTAWHERATALLRRAEEEVSAAVRALIESERLAWVEAHCPASTATATAPPARHQQAVEKQPAGAIHGGIARRSSTHVFDWRR